MNKKDKYKTDFFVLSNKYQWQMVEPISIDIEDTVAFEKMNDKDVRSFIKILAMKPEYEFFTFVNEGYHIIAEKK